MKVLSWNVHCFHSKDGMEQQKDILEYLKKHADNYDILALQEAVFPFYCECDVEKTMTLIAKICQLIGFKDSIALPEHGVVLLSRWKVKDKFTIVSPKYHHAENRGAVFVNLDNFGWIGNLHLDHIYKDARKKQFKYFIETFEVKFGKKPDAIVGDFNSLTDEYSSSKRKEIETFREKNNWKCASYDEIEYIKNFGFIDCWKELHCQIIDPRTSRRDTRIDYFLRYKNSQLRCASCEICNESMMNSTGLSDHYPVWGEFSLEK